MKKLAIVFILLSVITLISRENILAASKEKAEMKFSEIIHDFGTIQENGGPVSVEFPFTNTGNANLVIYDAKADCGCTIPDYPKAPVAPGKTGKIKVTYNPLGRPGAFDKVITVKTNGKSGKIRLKIRGSVMPKK
ncbi:MAG: DUF1573 domain-containing protein [Bacteroides sp.]|nr:DUF1573 domain-containing protein [Bacteroides sp.]